MFILLNKNNKWIERTFSKQPNDTQPTTTIKITSWKKNCVENGSPKQEATQKNLYIKLTYFFRNKLKNIWRINWTCFYLSLWCCFCSIASNFFSVALSLLLQKKWINMMKMCTPCKVNWIGYSNLQNQAFANMQVQFRWERLSCSRGNSLKGHFFLKL